MPSSHVNIKYYTKYERGTSGHLPNSEMKRFVVTKGTEEV